MQLRIQIQHHKYISTQGLSEEMHIEAFINWEKQFNTAIYFPDLRSDTELLTTHLQSSKVQNYVKLLLLRHER